MLQRETSLEDDIPLSLREMMRYTSQLDFFEDGSKLKTLSKLSQSSPSAREDEKSMSSPYHNTHLR